MRGNIRAKARAVAIATENAVQAAVIGYLQAVLPDVFVAAIPNAAARKRGGRAGNAVPGLRPGVPDLFFIMPKHDSTVYFVEIKRPGGVLSKAQLECHKELRQRGAHVTTVESVDEMRAALEDWNILTREVKP